MILLKKLSQRYKQFKEHPLIISPMLGMVKYCFINIILRLKTQPIIWNWVNNLRFYLTIEDSCLKSNSYFYVYDYEQISFMLNFLNSNDTFVDVGSNQGVYSLLSSSIIGCKTIAVEPIESTFNKLKMNVELNDCKNIVLSQVGLSDKKSKLLFYNSVGELNRVVSEKDTEESVELVNVTTLDELLIKEDKVSMIKIDVEGYEEKVLSGGNTVLQNKNLKVIQLELNRGNEKYNFKEKETFSILMQHGFYPYLYNPLEKKLIRLDTRNPQSRDTLFIRDMSMVEQRLSKKSVVFHKNRILIN